MKIGIIGGGQLAKMLVLSGLRGGIEFKVLSTAPENCVDTLCDVKIVKSLTVENTKAWARDCDVVTIDHETVDCKALSGLSTLMPTSKGISCFQDRYNEKKLLDKLDLSTTSYEKVPSLEKMKELVAQYKNDCILKKRIGGYDGKSQMWIVPYADIDENKVPEFHKDEWIIEKRVNFDYEVSLISTAAWDKENVKIIHYPIAKNIHSDGILTQSDIGFVNDVEFANHEEIENLENKARAINRKIITEMKYTGTICVEMFVTQDTLFVNEISPRVHNSGHWSIDGASISQFGSHLRAIMGRPLIEPKMLYPRVRMHNLIGKVPNLEEIYKAVPDCVVHIYGKKQLPGRKLGHVTFAGEDIKELDKKSIRFKNLIL